MNTDLNNLIDECFLLGTVPNSENKITFYGSTINGVTMFTFYSKRNIFIDFTNTSFFVINIYKIIHY